MERARKYAPVFVMDKDEPYWPSTIGDYVKNCRVIRVVTDAKGRETREVLLEDITDPAQIMAHDGWGVARLDLKTDQPARRHGVRSTALYPSKLEVYVFERRLRSSAPDDSDGDVADDVSYTMWFPYNGTSEPHVSDKEFIKIRFRNDQPVGAYLSNHATGYWVRWSDMALTPSGRPIVYVSRESHAMYHRPGTHYRALGFANDVIAPGRALELGADYDLVNHTKAVAGKPWLTWWGGRAADEDRPMLMDGMLRGGDNGCPITDYPALANAMLGRRVKIGLLVGLLGCVLLTLALGLYVHRAWLVALGVLPAVGLGVLWTVLTATVASASATSFAP
jgi:hypothetical protein